MNELKRKIKKTEIAVIWALFFLAIYYVIYHIVSIPKAVATCFDKIKNQNEEDVDCGGVCVPCKSEKQINITNINILRLENGYYRVIFEAENLNPDTAYKSVEYKIAFKTNSRILDEKYFSDFINQFEKKFVLSPAFLFFDNVDEATVEVAKLIKSDKKPTYLKNLILEGERAEFIDSDSDDEKIWKRIIVRGNLLNDSVINYDEVQVVALFPDSAEANKNKILTAGSTILYDIEPFKRRDFEIIIQTSEDVDLNGLIVYAYVNFSKYESL